MFDVDLDQFKVRKPWRDITFWAAVAWSAILIVAVVSPDAADWISDNQAALIAAAAPLVSWLTLHGFLRARAVEALGQATAAAAIARGVSDGNIGSVDTVVEADEPAGLRESGGK